MVAQIVVSKIVLHRSGLSGVGAFGTVMAISGLYGVLADLNVSPRMMRGVAAEQSGRERNRWHLSSMVVWAGVSAVLVGLTVAVASFFRSPYFGLSVTGLALVGLGGCLNMLVQMSALRAAAAGHGGQQAAIGLFSAVSTIASVLLLDREGTALALGRALAVAAFVNALMAVAVTFANGRSPHGAHRPPLLPSRSMIKELIRSGLSLSIAAVAGAGALLLQPLVVRSVLGEEALGTIRIASVLSTSLMSVFSLLLARWFMPIAIRGAKGQGRDRRSHALRLICLGAGAVSALSIGFGPLVVEKVFGVSAHTTRPILSMMSVGDAVRPIGVLFAMCLIAGGEEPFFVRLELFFGSLFVGLTAVLTSLFGSIGSPLAYVVTYVGYALVTVRLAKQSDAKRFGVANVQLLAIPSLVCAALGIVSRVSPTVSFVGGLVAAMAFGAIAIRDVRRSPA